MASHEGSRKRMRMMAGASSKPVDSTSIAVASSSKTNPAPSTAAVSCASGPCAHEQMLRTLHTDIDAMRQLVTCKVCDRLLYEPYALACGHTYCYQCLRQWFDNNPRKKTCPDCRVIVIREPTPSYILRELVLVFVSRNELLPDGETADEHHKWLKEESDLVTKDKTSTDPATGGLFKGMFKRGNSMRRFGPIHDPGDNVDRCPTCHWELESGYCSHCHQYVVDDSDIESGTDLSDDELDHDIDAEDDAFWGVDGHDEYLGAGTLDSHDDESDEEEDARPFTRHIRRDLEGDDLHTDNPWPSSDLEGDHSDGEDGDLIGFVVGDDEVAYIGSDGGEESDTTDVPRRRRFIRRMSPVVISDDEAETAASAGAPVTEEDDDDSEDEEPVVRGSQRNRRLGRRVISSSRHFSTSSSDDETNEEDASNHVYFSPIRDESDAGTSMNYDEAEGRYMDDSNQSYDEAEARYMDDRNQSSDEDDEDDEDDDGWDTETETPCRTRGAAPVTASHRLHTRGQHASRHTSSFLSGLLGRRSSPSNVRPGQRTMVGGREGTILPVGRRSHHSVTARSSPRGSGSVRAPTTNGSGPSRASNRAPTHPFQLDNTLASINGSYNQCVHHPMMQRLLEPSQASSSSGSGSNLTVRGDRHRKRALSLDSDENGGGVSEIDAYDAGGWVDE